MTTAGPDAPRVYSYTRFSTPEQARGDSARRQAAGVMRWLEWRNAERAEAHLPPLELDERLTLNDLGVSAFRGANEAGDRGLGGFLLACREGLVPRGSYLLIESFDRLSRRSPRRVVPLLNEIVDADVTIVTMSDGREYDAASLDADPLSLMIAFMVAMRAHEESKVKGQRVAAAWAQKRQRVREGLDAKLTVRGPAWLHWDGEAWQERAPHAETVRLVYQMTLRGMGEHKIAGALNAEGVPMMGRGKMWHRSTVAKLLRNPAAVGTLTPGRMEYGTGRRERKLEAPIPNAYPAVIDEPTWLAVRAIKDGRAPATRGRGATAPLSNIFAGLARCPDCGAAMTRVYKGARGGRPKLVCTRAKVGAADHPYRSVTLDDLQDAFERNWQNLLADIPAGEGAGSLDDEYRSLDAAISAVEDGLADLSDAIARKPSQTLASRIRAQEAQLASMRADLARLAEQREIADHGLVVARVGALADAMGHEQEAPEPLDIARVNAALRSLFSGVVVDHRGGVLAFQWRQGGQTDIQYAWPMEGHQ